MAVFALTDAQIFAGAYDLRSRSNEVNVEQRIDELDATTFGSAGVKERKAGLRDVSITTKGLADPSITDSIFTALGSTSDLLISVSPTATAGDAIYSARGAMVANWSGEETLGELRAFSTTLSGRNPRGLTRQTIVRAHSAATGAGTGTAYLIGATSSTQTLVSAIHLTALSGSATPTLTVTVQSDSTSGFASPTTIGSHTALTAIGASWLESAGPITDTYFRITWTLTGTAPSATFIASIGIA